MPIALGTVSNQKPYKDQSEDDPIITHAMLAADDAAKRRARLWPICLSFALRVGFPELVETVGFLRLRYL